MIRKKRGDISANQLCIKRLKNFAQKKKDAGTNAENRKDSDIEEGRLCEKEEEIGSSRVER